MSAVAALAAIPAAGALILSETAPDAPVAVPVWLELIAIVVASVSGVLTAREKKLDLVGAVCLAVICSLGGGLLRDVTLQVGNVYILTQPAALPASVITAIIVFLIPSVVAKQDRLIAVLDIFSVGLYAATGADKALVYGFSPIICVMMGFFTGVGGGMLRDICLGQTPYIFQQSNLYAVAAIAGATAYTLIAGMGVSHAVAVVACVVITMGIRWASLRYNIVSPTEVDLTKVDLRELGDVMGNVVPGRTMRRHEESAGSGTGAGPKPRVDRPDRTRSALAARRKRTLADIDRRRKQERRAAALERLRRYRRSKRQGS